VIYDYIDVLGDQSLIVTEDGEIVESHGPDRLSVVATRRHDAYQQIKRWEAVLANFDRVLLQNGVYGAFGGIVINSRQSSYTKTDVQKFVEEIPEMSYSELEALARAASGFKREKLPEMAIKAYDAATARIPKRPWIESAIAHRAAPEIAHVITEEAK